ncbi:MAG TPA: PD-(D/E)XK nuclease family protein [Thermoleophilaceae bacterium]|nr:PD-(D/E)XK nuclease family protein [Thermoleophilaceae bacterium]
MPLKLVTGPANSAKAGVVLGGYRDRLDEEPVLVVPEYRDVEHAQREMAANGAVFGVRVVRFGWLWDLMARRVGYSARIATRFQRELLVGEAVGAAELRVLAASAARPGFTRAAARFVAEVGRAGVEPDELGAALSRWAGTGQRRAYAREIAAICTEYRAALERAGLVDRELFAWRALAAFRERPASWGRTPVFVYGFDDFTDVELAGIEALAEHVDVTLSFPYERGRHAFDALADQFARLEAAADDHVELAGVPDHYAPSARAALHHLERGLFDASGERVDAGAAVRIHSAGGARAEVELAAASVLEQLAGGTGAGDIAVVFRNPERYASLVDQVFSAYGIPFSLDRKVKLGHTALGRGVLALLRCAVPGLGGTTEDLLTYLRAPGRLDVPGLADRLEADARREGVREADEAREVWESRNGRMPLSEIDSLRGAAGDPQRLLGELARRIEWLFSRPYLRRAHVFARDEVDLPRTFATARDAIGQMRALGGSAPTGQDLHDALHDLDVVLGDPPQPDRVQVTGPLEVRARRFEVLYLLGLQEGEFPQPARTDPFLSDDDRREIASVAGLDLPVREEQLDRERYLFYVCASRAERLLVLSARTSDEEGGPEQPSFFLEDIAELIDLPERPHATRGLSDVVWDLGDAPTRQEWERAAAAAGPRVPPRVPERLASEELVRRLVEEHRLSAGAIETFADCPVKWLIDRRLRPEALEPEAEQLVRGSFAHEVLQRVYSDLREHCGERAVTPANLSEAERFLLAALRDLQADFPISPDRTRVRAAVRKLEFDLLRFLRREAESASRFEPDALELAFGEDDEKPISIGIEGLELIGRIDRVDTADGRALVRDYKTGRSRADHGASRWRDEHRLQVAVYMLALQELRPDLELAGGVYEALAGSDAGARGLLLEDARDELGEGWTRTDWRDREGFDAVLDDARQAVREVLERMRSGDVRPCPGTCAWNGGCSYPAICRYEE